MGLNSTNYLAMAASANSEIQSLLNQLQSEGIDTTKANYYLNSIYDVGMNGLASTSDNPYVKSQSIQNMLIKLSELVAVIAIGGGNNANKTVNNNNKEIESTKNDVEKMNQNLGQKLQSILDECDGNADKINKIIDEIEKLGGDDSGEAAMVQKQLEEQLQIIEQQKEILNSDNTEASERKAAIAAILGAASVINGLTEKIISIKAKLDEKTQEVTQIDEENTNLMTTAESTVAEGIQGIAKESAEFTQEGVKTTQLGTEGATRSTVGTAEVATGTAMSEIPATAVEGQRMVRSGNKNINAGQTLMAGSAEGITKIFEGTGEVGSFYTELNEYAQGVGQFSTGFEELIGSYNAIAEPLITAIGSYENIGTANSELQDYVNVYASEATGVNISKDRGNGLEEFNDVDEDSIKKIEFTFETDKFKPSQV